MPLIFNTGTPLPEPPKPSPGTTRASKTTVWHRPSLRNLRLVPPEPRKNRLVPPEPSKLPPGTGRASETTAWYRPRFQNYRLAPPEPPKPSPGTARASRKPPGTARASKRTARYRPSLKNNHLVPPESLKQPPGEFADFSVSIPKYGEKKILLRIPPGLIKIHVLGVYP